MRGANHNGDQYKRAEQPIDHEPGKRKPEHVEAHILGKEWVVNAEWLMITKQHPLLPLRHRRQANHEPEYGADDTAQEPLP